MNKWHCILLQKICQIIWHTHKDTCKAVKDNITLYVCMYFLPSHRISTFSYVNAINWILRHMAISTTNFHQDQLLYAAMLMQEKRLGSWLRALIWIHSKIECLLSWPMLHPSTTFHENRYGTTQHKVRQTTGSIQKMSSDIRLYMHFYPGSRLHSKYLILLYSM